jgi:hypothetical protein
MIDFDESVNFVVGIAGGPMSAALAIRAGAKSVVVLNNIAIGGRQLGD